MACSSRSGQVMTESLILIFLLVLISVFIVRMFQEAQIVHKKVRWEIVQ